MKQINKNPGGIVLDFGENIFSIGAVEEAVGNRLARNSEFVVDVILRANDSVVHVLRYDGRKNKRR